MLLIGQKVSRLIVLGILVSLQCACGGQKKVRSTEERSIYISLEEERLAIIRYNPCFYVDQQQGTLLDLELLMISEDNLLMSLQTGIQDLKGEEAWGEVVEEDISQLERDSLLRSKFTEEQRIKLVKIALDQTNDRLQRLQWERVALNHGDSLLEPMNNSISNDTNIVVNNAPSSTLNRLLSALSVSTHPYALVHLKLKGTTLLPNGHRLRRGELLQEVGISIQTLPQRGE